MIRPILPGDLPALRRIVDATGLFPSELLLEMPGPWSDAGQGIWLTCADPEPVSVAYCAPEPMTSGTWNLYLMAVSPERQGFGAGTALLRSLEAMLAGMGARVLLVETSGLPEFAVTRGFYAARGFVEEARIRAFYADGEDKVVFWKGLSGREM